MTPPGCGQGYFWPVARAIFTRTGATAADRRVRRIVAWIRRTGALDISVEDVRVGVLGRAVDAAGATALIERLVKGGVLRPAAAKDTKGTRRQAAVRWDVNPALHALHRRAQTMRKWLRPPRRFPVFPGFPAAVSGVKKRHLCNTLQLLKPPQRAGRRV